MGGARALPISFKGNMKIHELKRRLHELNPDLNIIIYGREKDIRAHRGMCSVTYRGEHLYSMKQAGDIPKRQNRNYGTLDKFSGQFIIHMSVWKLGVKLAQKGLIHSPKELLE